MRLFGFICLNSFILWLLELIGLIWLKEHNGLYGPNTLSFFWLLSLFIAHVVGLYGALFLPYFN